MKRVLALLIGLIVAMPALACAQDGLPHPGVGKCPAGEVVNQLVQNSGPPNGCVAAVGSQEPINLLPAQTGNYNAQGFDITDVGTISAVSGVLSSLSASIGNCLQVGTNGAITATGSPCGSSSGGYNGPIHNQNLVPDSDIKLGTTYWTVPGTFTIGNAVGGVGGNAFIYAGIGSAQSDTRAVSGVITVQAGGTYTISGYIDATNSSAGFSQWIVLNANTGVGYGQVTQTNGQKGFLSGTVTIPGGVTSVVVVARVDLNNVPIGQNMYFSNPQLEFGGTAGLYKPNLIDDLSGHFPLGAIPGSFNSNLIPDTEFQLGSTYWTLPAGFVFSQATGSTGGTSIAYQGTGGAGSDVHATSAIITVVPGATYTLSGCLNSTNSSGGLAQFIVSNLAGVGEGVISVNPGVSSCPSATFTMPGGVTQVVIWARADALNVPLNQNVYFSRPQLEAGSLQGIYKPNLLDRSGVLPTRAYRPMTTWWNWIIGYGQSLACGSNGASTQPAIDTTPFFPYDVVAVNDANNGWVCYPSLATPYTSLQPYHETVAETIGTYLTSTLENYTRAAFTLTYPAMFTVMGQGGEPYNNLKQGTAPYNAVLTLAPNLETLSPGVGMKVQALDILHGESDACNGESEATYESDLVTWQANFQTDLEAITLQSGIIPMVTDQTVGFTSGVVCTLNQSGIPLAQWQVSIDHPTLFVTVGPKYQFPYQDGTHLTPFGYQLLGQYHAKAFEGLLKGVHWLPLQPHASGISISTATITAVFDVPVAPLVLDTTLVTSPNGAGDGFEYWDASGTPVIVTGCTETAQEATCTTSGAHGLSPNQIVQIAGISITGYNGNYKLDTASGSTFTFAPTTTGLGAGSGGTVTPASATITGVSVSGSTATITLSGAPVATVGNRHLRYAYTGVSGALAGATTGIRGNLRDSDPLISTDGSNTPLYNWAVSFDETF